MNKINHLKDDLLLHEDANGLVGSCWCGSDAYCMCTPSLAIDAIIEVWPTSTHNKIPSDQVSLVLVNRGVPPKGFAITGYFYIIADTFACFCYR